MVLFHPTTVLLTHVSSEKPKAKIDVFIPTFWRTILNNLNVKQSGMINIIRIIKFWPKMLFNFIMKVAKLT